MEDKIAAALRDLMKELEVNLVESPELQNLYHNKHVKKQSYWLEEFVRLSAKHIKTKRNPKLEYKYLGSLEILKAVGKQAYKLKLPTK